MRQPRGGSPESQSCNSWAPSKQPRTERPSSGDTALAPPRRETMPALELVQRHFAQQLVLEGNITGTEEEGIFESDRRVDAVLRDRMTPILNRVVEQLEDAHEDDHIDLNTYVQLVDAAKRSFDRLSAPPAVGVNHPPEVGAQRRRVD